MNIIRGVQSSLGITYEFGGRVGLEIGYGAKFRSSPLMLSPPSLTGMYQSSLITVAMPRNVPRRICGCGDGQDSVSSYWSFGSDAQ